MFFFPFFLSCLIDGNFRDNTAVLARTILATNSPNLRKISTSFLQVIAAIDCRVLHHS